VRTRWLALTVVIALSIVWLLSVFGTGPSSSHAAAFGPIPVAPDAIRTEGEPIADGFTVVPGTALVGDVFEMVKPEMKGFEQPDVPDDRVWYAVLLVTADLPGVVQAYGRQARALGFDRHGGTECSAGTTSSFCRGIWTDKDAGLVVSISDGRGHVPTGPTSHLVLWYADFGEFSMGSGTAPASAEREDGAMPALPRVWPALAGVGERMFVAHDVGRPNYDGGQSVPMHGVPPALTVAAGSELASPVAGSTLGWVAVLRVTGDPREVLGRYRQQLRASDGFTMNKLKARPVGDATSYRFSAGDFSGHEIGSGTSASYDFMAIERSAGTWMLIIAQTL